MITMTIITHHGNGTASALATGEVRLDQLGPVRLRRLSHIWPTCAWRRRAFCLLRLCGGDRGRLADWTRRWRGPWEVRLAADVRTVVFTAPTRRECLAWERAHFTSNPP